MYMSYDEYVETFESLKGQDKAKEGKAASGTEEEGGWRPSMGVGHDRQCVGKEIHCLLNEGKHRSWHSSPWVPRIGETVLGAAVCWWRPNPSMCPDDPGPSPWLQPRSLRLCSRHS